MKSPFCVFLYGLFSASETKELRSYRSPLGATPSLAMKAISGYSELMGACSFLSISNSPTLRCSQTKIGSIEGSRKKLRYVLVFAVIS